MMCARCRESFTYLVRAYWGDQLCKQCCRTVAAFLDEHDKWPAIQWDDDAVCM